MTTEPWCNHDEPAINAAGVCECGVRVRGTDYALTFIVSAEDEADVRRVEAFMRTCAAFTPGVALVRSSVSAVSQ